MSFLRPATLLAKQGVQGLVRSKTVLGALFVGGIAIALAIFVRFAGGATPDKFPVVAAVLLTGLESPLIALLLGTWAMGSEREGSTLVFLFTRPIRRSSVLAGRAAAALGVSVALVVAVGLACAAVYGIPLGDAGSLAMLLALETTTFVAIFVLMGTVLPRALYVGLAYAALVEGLLGGIVNLEAGLTVGQHARNLLARWLTTSPATTADLKLPQDAGASVLTLLAVAAIALAAAAAWTELREMPLRERVKGE